jgi:hypothetical protein
MKALHLIPLKKIINSSQINSNHMSKFSRGIEKRRFRKLEPDFWN